MRTIIKKENLENHQRYLELKEHIHKFFTNKECMRIEAPSLAPSFEPHSGDLTVPTVYTWEDGETHPAYLIPWPDHYYLRFLAHGMSNIYMLHNVFRNNESLDQTHLPEFDMLEFYEMNGTYNDLLERTRELLQFLCEMLPEANSKYNGQTVETISLQEAFHKYTKFSREAFWDNDTLLQEANTLGYSLDSSAREVWLDVVDKEIEPHLGNSQMTVLKDFPAYIDNEGVLNEDGKTTQRFEFFMKGIEIGNCYTINVHGEERYKDMRNTIAKRKEKGLDQYTYDEELMELFRENKIPPHASMTIGVERLAMVLLGLDSVADLKVVYSSK